MPLSAPISIRLRGHYKSITELEWHDIPPLAIITGINGSGKTQLLEALHLGLTGFGPRGDMALRLKELYGDSRVEVEGDQYDPTEISYIPGSGALGNLGGVNLQGFKKQVNNLITGLYGQPHKPQRLEPDHYYLSLS